MQRLSVEAKGGWENNQAEFKGSIKGRGRKKHAAEPVIGSVAVAVYLLNGTGGKKMGGYPRGDKKEEKCMRELANGKHWKRRRKGHGGETLLVARGGGKRESSWGQMKERGRRRRPCNVVLIQHGQGIKPLVRRVVEKDLPLPTRGGERSTHNKEGIKHKKRKGMSRDKIFSAVQ